MAGERILVVDDEPGVRSALEGILRDEGFTVITAESGEQAIEQVTQMPFDAALLDVWLPGRDGIETLTELRQRTRDLEVVMISGHATIDTAVRATKLGAFDFIEKPLSIERTLLVLRNALRQRRLEQRNRRLLDQLDRQTEILGRSPAMDQVRSQAEAAAAADAPVLIVGERGTGREIVARRIHARSKRSEESFVSVPAAALDDAAAAVALFGDGERPGRLALAEGGSLFLEDVDRLSPELQERLAVWLDMSRGEGSGARLLASAAEVVAEGWHEPLLRRLDVMRIAIPPVRERREDIPLIAEKFMRDISLEYARPEKRFDPEVLARFRAHDWPGNVRELSNLVERLVLMSGGATVDVSDLPEELGGDAGPAEDLYRTFESLEQGLAAYARFAIGRALAQAGGDRAKAAAALKTSEEALVERMQAAGMESGSS